MRPVVLHAAYVLANHGVKVGIENLLEGGFYKDFDVRVVSLFRPAPGTTERLAGLLGSDRIVTLIDEPPLDTFNFELERNLNRAVAAFSEAFIRYQPATAILSEADTQIPGRFAALNHPSVKIISFDHTIFPYSQYAETMLRQTKLRNDARFADAAGTLDRRAYLYDPGTPAYTVPIFALRVVERNLRLTPSPFNVLSMGRLSPEKNYSELIRAVAMLIVEGRDIRLTIAGGGSARKQLDGLLFGLGQKSPDNRVFGKINLIGFISNSDKKDLLRRESDIYVQPSIGSESFGLAAAEAVAAGIPTIVTKFPGAYEFGSAESLIKLDGYSAEHIAGGLRYLMDHYDTLAPKMVRASTAIIRERFSPEAVDILRQQPIAEMAAPRASGRLAAGVPVYQQ